MPHFFANNLDFLNNSRQKSGKNFHFLLEARNLRDNSLLILAESKSDSHQKVMLTAQKKGENFLVKFNKHFKVNSREAIKSALKDYANLTNANIISHNLNDNKRESQSKYLLDSQGILEILDSHKMHESSADSTHPLASSAREWESMEGSRFKNAPKFLEIGFGSGRHILNLAQNNPNALIIGLEIYRPAILQVLRQIELLNLNNLFIANIDARLLFEVAVRESLNAIFLHFPVPWEKNPQRRVFSKSFLTNAIRTLNTQNGRFELVTDSKEYFDFAKNLARIYKTKTTQNPQNAVISKYEARWRKLQKNIYKLEIFPHKKAIFRLLDSLKRFATPLKKMLESKNFADKNNAPNFANLAANLNAIHSAEYPKVRKKEYFLQIKDIYKFDGGFVIYAVFGAYYAPNSAYFIVQENDFKILGDIILSSANKSAIDELKRRILGS